MIETTTKKIFFSNPVHKWFSYNYFNHLKAKSYYEHKTIRDHCRAFKWGGLPWFAPLWWKFCPACPFPDRNSALLALFPVQNPALLVNFLAKICFPTPWLCFSNKNPFLVFVFILKVLFLSLSILFYLFFLINCSSHSVLSNNILQIFECHWFRIVSDIFLPKCSFHCTNTFCCDAVIINFIEPLIHFPIPKTEKGTSVFV